MEKQYHDIDFFLKNEKFRDWVINPSLENTHYWNSWIEENPQYRDAFNLAKQVSENIRFEEANPTLEDQNRVFDNIQNSLKESRSLVVDKPKTFSWVWKAAAILVVISGLALYFLQSYYSTKESPTIVYLTRTAEIGEKLTIKLPDGSVINLNSASTIRYPKDFSGETRDISLVGEAFFDVQENPEKPFIVKLDDISVKVLGTRFNIKSYNDKSISLVEGSVLITNDNSKEFDDIILKPGEAFEEFAAGKWRKIDFDQSKTLAWLNKTLVFEDSNLQEVIETLERWYGISIQVTREDLNNQFSLTASYTNLTLENVLQLMSHSNKFNYEIKEDSVLIQF